MKKDKIIYIGIGILAVMVIFFASDSYKKTEVKASAPTGYQAVNASSSNITLAGNQMLQIMASSTCVSRIITAPSGSLMTVMFSDNAIVPSPGVGHLLVASTTSVFDSGIYGCGLMRASNNNASTSNFTITEFTNFR